VSGYNTDQPIRERGWTHWHQLFTPRQLLIYGCYLEFINRAENTRIAAGILLKLTVQANWNSKLCIWNPDKSKGPGSTEPTFANQALNTLVNYGTRSFWMLRDSLLKDFDTTDVPVFTSEVLVDDARDLRHDSDIWITDPP
jgi:putative DNA methylase